MWPLRVYVWGSECVCVCAWQISISVCMPQGAFIERPWHGLSIMSKRLVESNGHPCLPNWPQIRYMNQYGSYYLQPSPACRERFCLGITLQSGLYFSVCLCQVMHFWWFRSLYLGKVLAYKIIHSCYDIPTSHTTWCYTHFSHKLLLVLQSCVLYLNTCRHWMVLAVLIIASLFMLFTVLAFLGLLFCQWGKCFIMWVRISTWGDAAWMIIWGKGLRNLGSTIIHCYVKERSLTSHHLIVISPLFV